MRPTRLLPALFLVGAVALTAVTLAPPAAASCVPRGDGQDLVCAEPVGYDTGTCLRYFANPPLSGTSAGGYLCQPVELCQQTPTGCTYHVCVNVVKPMCVMGVLRVLPPA